LFFFLGFAQKQANEESGVIKNSKKLKVVGTKQKLKHFRILYQLMRFHVIIYKIQKEEF
jgi:hypothetical protein